jgi:hypothetical protein
MAKSQKQSVVNSKPLLVALVLLAVSLAAWLISSDQSSTASSPDAGLTLETTAGVAAAPGRKSSMGVPKPFRLGFKAFGSSSSDLLIGLPVNRTLKVPEDLLPVESPGLTQVCAHLQCTRDASCLVTDPSCCMFYTARLIDFMSRFLAAKGLEQDWFAVYGTVVGAVRHPGGLLPWTNDLDIGMTPKLLATLLTSQVRDELWQYGWYLFKGDLWKVCAHAQHPDPTWQAGFTKPLLASSKQRQQEAKDSSSSSKGGRPKRGPPLPNRGKITAGYMDLWPVAPLGSTPNGTYFTCDPCPDPTKLGSRNLWHLWKNIGWLQVTFRRRASVAGVVVTIPDNAEEHLALVYGGNWRTPNATNHGVNFQDWTCPLKAPFSGEPGAV